MVWVEKYPCNNAHEASARESEIYQELNADLNSKKPHGRYLERKQDLQKNTMKSINNIYNNYEKYIS